MKYGTIGHTKSSIPLTESVSDWLSQLKYEANEMKNTSLSRITSSLATVVLVFVTVARADAEVNFGVSIESRVAFADAIIRASVTTVDAKNGANGLVVETATLKVNETLKGIGPEHLKHSVTLYSPSSEKFDSPSIWKQEAVELLLFLKNGKVQSLLRLDGKKSQDHGHRAFTLDMKVCKTKNSILAAVYGALEFGEKEKPIGEITIEAGGAVFSELWGGSVVFLAVPLDSRIESAAKRWSSSNDGILKKQATRILEEIKKAKNAKTPRRTPVNPN